MRLIACLLVLSIPLAGCDHRRAAAWPALAPRSDFQSAAGGMTDPQALTKASGGIDARVAALRARAALMQGPVIDPETLARLNAAITRLQP